MFLGVRFEMKKRLFSVFLVIVSFFYIYSNVIIWIVGWYCIWIYLIFFFYEWSNVCKEYEFIFDY